MSALSKMVVSSVLREITFVSGDPWIRVLILAAFSVALDLFFSPKTISGSIEVCRLWIVWKSDKELVLNMN